MDAIFEQRKHERLKTREGAFVYFRKARFFGLGKSLIVKQAPVVNISKKGLSFLYIDNKMWPAGFNELDISTTSGEIKIDRIPFKIISDYVISKPADSMPVRRCGIKFENLNPYQELQLNNVIQNYTMDKHLKIV